MRNIQSDRNENTQPELINSRNVVQPDQSEELVYADEKRADYGDAYNFILPMESSGTNLHDELWMSGNKG